LFIQEVDLNGGWRSTRITPPPAVATISPSSPRVA
jgi:hypothetical protein